MGNILRRLNATFRLFNLSFGHDENRRNVDCSMTVCAYVCRSTECTEYSLVQPKGYCRFSL